VVANLATYGADFWLAPGARSQALAIAAAQLAQAGISNLRVRIDERSLAFTALGASVSGRPQVVITTSGTAVANLHPAVLEAHHSGIPLILLTADRPAELRGKGANQTTNQVGIFADAVIACVDVEAPTDDKLTNLPQQAAKVVSEAMHLALANKQPVQLNLQFREPLSATEPDAVKIYSTLAPWEISKTRDEYLAVELSPKTVVIAGANSDDFLDEISNLNLPVFAEPSSGVRHIQNSISGYRFALFAKDELVEQIEQVIVYGKPTLSRPIISLLRSGVKVYVRPSRMGSFQIPDDVEVISNAIAYTGDKSWLDSWQELSNRLTPKETNELNRRTIVEGAWRLGPDDHLVLGASQLIREADHFAPKTAIKVWSNRGLSGIDGTIATATGIALNTKGKVRVLLGDLTFLHDVGSLVIDKSDGELDIQLVVVNDHGGKIFSYLEVAGSVEEKIYNRVFRTGQDFEIAALAQAFGWQYLLVKDLVEYHSALETTGRVIIEIKLD